MAEALLQKDTITLRELQQLNKDALVEKTEVGQKQQKAHYSASSKSCHYCKTPGHLIADSRKLKAKEAVEAGQSRDRAVLEAAFKCCDLSNVVGSVEVAVPSGFKCFSDTRVSSKIKLDPDVGISDAADADLVMASGVDSFSIDATSDSSSTPKSVTLFRDTSEEQTLLKYDAIPISMLTSLGKEVLIKGVTTGYDSIPLYQIHFDCKYVVGPVTVGLGTTFLIDGVDLLLGNDIAGDKVYAVPIVQSKPETDQETAKLETLYPGIFPECAVTWSQTTDMNSEASVKDLTLVQLMMIA
ncbi:Hypothetical predicted protein [Octopus vulgaris]|uniref:Uncharacterized protein n=1 Tax=Octopus vulgaris TaxID=6645 RepID=A0AA36BGF4_OCTVU|nr:Hypothetical predicted protein [Octopus vulgaris]